MRSAFHGCRADARAVRRHDVAVQDPVPAPVVTSVPEPGNEVVTALQNLGWVDITALSVLGVFFVIGLFKGFVWQVSRVAILVVAYGLAAHFGQAGADLLLSATHSGPEPATQGQQETAFYVACVLIFLVVLVVLSLLSLVLQKFVKTAGLTFFDRLGGGVVGVATGGCVVLFLMTAVLMFFPRSEIAAAADESYSLRLSRKAIDLLEGALPPELTKIFREPEPEHAPHDPAGLPGDGLRGEPLPGDPPPAVPGAPNGGAAPSPAKPARPEKH